MQNDEKYLIEALKEAKKAKAENEVPVGAVIVCKDKIIARGYNKSIGLNDPCAHAEIIALRKAAKKLKNYRLCGCKIYVTIEPCAMCAGALVWARVSEIIYGAKDSKAGACGSIVNIADNKKFNHRLKVRGGVLEKESGAIIKEFFRRKRRPDFRESEN